MIPVVCYWILLNILLRIFASIFIRQVGPQVYFIVVFWSDFGYQGNAGLSILKKKKSWKENRANYAINNSIRQ